MANSPPTVAILYGFAEGTWYSRKLRTELKNHGYKLTSEYTKADIIVAHSGGCYLVPDSLSAKLIIHVGYTYWPGRSLLSSLISALDYDRKLHGLMRWLISCLMHDLYMLNIMHSLRMIPGWRRPKQALRALPRTRHIFISNKEDSYCNPRELMTVRNEMDSYLGFPGGHMDLWDNPKRYVNLLQSVHG